MSRNTGQIRALLTVSLALIAWLTPLSAGALSLVLDQVNDVEPTGFAITPSPNGQQFQPSLPWLGQIDVWLQPFDGGAIHLEVYQHDSVAGALLGLSNSLAVADVPGHFYAFDFPIPVPVLVGSQTVFKIVGPRTIVGLGGDYPLGSAVWDDNPVSGDLVFREWGAASLEDEPQPIPEPAGLLLVGSGLIGVGRAIWRGR